MPYLSSHSRTYSWPPSFHILDIASSSDRQTSKEETLPDIDEDPFAHFITAVTEEDDPFDALSMSAGIEPSNFERSSSRANKFSLSKAKKWARYVARNHQLLHGIYHDEEEDYLDKATSAYPAEPIPSISVENEDGLEMYHDKQGRQFRVELREPTRGRAQDLLTPERRQRGRRTSRTLSGHRRSWREPSPELFTVSEEEESGGNIVASTVLEENGTDDGESWRSAAPRSIDEIACSPGITAKAKL